MTLTRFWHRRICEAVMLVSLIILALYFWAYFADVKSISAALLVKDSAAIAAAASFFSSFVSYLWAPKKYTFWGAYIAFVLLSITTAILIINTGDTSSPFLALWMAVSVFAGVFGVYGFAPLFVTVTGYLVMQFLGTSNEESIVAVILAGELPLALSYLLWHNKGAEQKSSDRAYHELATELSEVAGKSEVVINAIGDGVIALDGKGIIQLINPAAQQIIGWGKQDALSLDYKSVLKLADNKDADVVPANDPVVQALATNQEVTTNNLKLVTNSGKKRLVSVVVSPIGQLGAGVIIVFRDITKEKAEEREQAEFISTASHEMRTPVASIEGYLGLALNPATAQIDDKARDFINKAHESAQHLGHLFQDLLDVTKADDGRISNNPKVVDVVEFTHTIAQGLRPKAEEKGLRMLFKPQPDDEDEDDKKGERRISPVYYGNVDNDHLREIIANLIENAIKYTPKGDVVIDVTGDTDHIVISIADSGIGIPKEDQAHLFQKFYRVDNSDTREIGGTGLGLYLCRRLAEGMSGRVWVESEYKQGSTFYLEIPRIDHEEAMRLIETAETKNEEEISNVVLQQPTLPQSPTVQDSTTVISAQTQPTTPPDTVDTAYTNKPVESVAQQLQSIRSMPITTPQPSQPAATPSQPTTQTYQPPQAPQYTAAPAVAPPQPQQASYIPTRPIVEKPNTPLSSIEQHPDQYTRQRPSVMTVPSRRQD